MAPASSQGMSAAPPAGRPRASVRAATPSRRAAATRPGNAAIIANAGACRAALPSAAVHQPQHALVAAVGGPARHRGGTACAPARQVRCGQVGHPRGLRQPGQVRLEQARPAVADQQRLEDAVAADSGQVSACSRGACGSRNSPSSVTTTAGSLAMGKKRSAVELTYVSSTRARHRTRRRRRLALRRPARRAARRAEAVVVDRSHRSVLTLTGSERRAWLHSISTQHVSDLPDGAVTQNLSLDGQGVSKITGSRPSWMASPTWTPSRGAASRC